jgi:UDP-N-acetylmuramoyl-L-alanyl-D-glutamate--2,6-diaminopimelate ligase
MALASLWGRNDARMLTLSRLVAGVPGVTVVRGGDSDVARVQVDSRRVGPHDLFVAIPGLHRNGMHFAADALERGAAGVVGPADATPPSTGAWLVAEDARLAAALLATRAWDRPSRRLDVLGVTGTNGKTTTAFLVRSIWSAAGRRTAILGTLGTLLPDGELPQARTTPEAPDVQRTLDQAVQQGAHVAVLEVSSHALDLRRVDGTEFAAAAFLNLTPEHLDWHGSIEAYGESKRRLFSDLLSPGRAPNGPRAVLHADDPWANHLREVVDDALFFGLESRDAAVTAHGVRAISAGAAFTLESPAGSAEIELSLPGRHNVVNALAAAGLAIVMGIPLGAIADGLSTAAAPAGRFERVHSGSFDAYVDYAHTEDGLRRTLDAAREITRGRVIVVLGCGGERDRDKRPIMGGLAAGLADLAIFTTDNPRSEDPDMIVEEMLRGAGSRRDHVVVEMDRERALARAVEAAGEGDLVLACGKGHEAVQSIAGEDQPFPEREILARLAARRDGAKG